MAKVKSKTKKTAAFVEKITFQNVNYLIFFIGIAVIIAGYIIMASGDTYSFLSLTLAPVVLIIGYLVIIPIAILYKGKNNQNSQQP